MNRVNLVDLFWTEFTNSTLFISMEILSLFACFSPLISTTSIRQLAIIAEAVFSMTGRVTMLGISRWARRGGSYRTVQRFFATSFLWTALHVQFVESHLFNASHEYILAADATTVTKAGKTTDRKSTRLNSSHSDLSRMPSSA